MGQESGRARPWFPWTYGVGESALPHSFIHSANMPQGTLPGPRLQGEVLVMQGQTGPWISQSHPLQRAQESTRREKRTREYSANRVRSTRRRDGASIPRASRNQGQARGWTSGPKGPFREVDVEVLPLVWGRGTCASCKLDLDNEQRRQGVVRCAGHRRPGL